MASNTTACSVFWESLCYKSSVFLDSFVYDRSFSFLYSVQTSCQLNICFPASKILLLLHLSFFSLFWDLILWLGSRFTIVNSGRNRIKCVCIIYTRKYFAKMITAISLISYSFFFFNVTLVLLPWRCYFSIS